MDHFSYGRRKYSKFLKDSFLRKVRIYSFQAFLHSNFTITLLDDIMWTFMKFVLREYQKYLNMSNIATLLLSDKKDYNFEIVHMDELLVEWERFAELTY